MNYISTTKKVI